MGNYSNSTSNLDSSTNLAIPIIGEGQTDIAGVTVTRAEQNSKNTPTYHDSGINSIDAGELSTYGWKMSVMLLHHQNNFLDLECMI